MKVNKKCECIFCPTCKGYGNLWVSFSGKHFSSERFDDLADLEPCFDCGGDGISQMCLKCQLEYENEYDRFNNY
jgi:hypothetical protein